MALGEFDVLGEQLTDEQTDTVIRAGDPRRSLVRYRADGSEFFVRVRLNPALLRQAASLPILLLKPASREGEVLKPKNPALLAEGGWDLLTPEGSQRNYALLERLCADLAAAAMPACYLAERHGDDRRDFYFVTEDVAGFERIARAAAEALSFPLTIDHLSLGEAAPVILPTEAIGELGLVVPPAARTRPTRFEFWGADASLTRLRAELEQRGFRYAGVDRGLSELRMIATVAIDGPGFLAVLRQIAPLARSLGCSYRGTETMAGSEQFALTHPLPDRYAADKPAGVFGRLFGKR